MAKIVSLAPFAHLSSLIPIDELEVIAARNSLETSTIVEATADDNQYYGTRQPSFEIPRQSEPDPVLQVTAETAASIAKGLNGTLPRWNEWEIATRGEDGRLYPWGDDIDLSLLSIEYQNYSVDDEGVMGYYRYDQDVYFVHSFGDYVNQPSPFGLIGLACPGREWNLADANLPASEQPFILRSLSDLGGMAMMIPGFRPNTWGFGNWHKTKRELAFSGPSLPCYAEGNVGNKYNQLIYPTAGFRLVVKKK